MSVLSPAHQLERGIITMFAGPASGVRYKAEREERGRATITGEGLEASIYIMLPGDERNVESGTEPNALVVRICTRVAGKQDERDGGPDCCII